MDMDVNFDDIDDDVASNGMSYSDALAIRQQTDLLHKVLEALASAQNKQPISPNVSVAAPQINVEVPQQAAPQVVVKMPAAAKPISWVFSFKRNQDGTIKEIIANPKA